MTDSQNQAKNIKVFDGTVLLTFRTGICHGSAELAKHPSTGM